MDLRAEITLVKLPDVPRRDLVAHMSDSRLAAHMPLLTGRWDDERVAAFIAAKEACWDRDGLGHWGILANGAYVGWGGFQKEGEEWDYGLVLKPSCFGLGLRITRLALAFAAADERIPHVTFLLPPSRKKLAALVRLGATFIGEVEHQGARFLKYRLGTAKSNRSSGS
ncbi:MAG: GNAT family N-acetyltransferase [Hyphomicrobiaceae bacterium]